MKTTVSVLTLALAAAIPVQAQMFRPETVSGAVLGGVAGAIIGNNSGRGGHGWEGAAYGVAAGALLGSAVGQSRERSTYQGTQVPVPVYSYANAPVYRTSPVYRETVSSRPNYAATGTLLGGIAGAIIGHNDGRHGWEGAAYGAGAGLLLGAIAENQARKNEAAASAIADLTAAQSAAPAAASMQPVIVNNYYGSSSTTATTPMSTANGLFGR